MILSINLTIWKGKEEGNLEVGDKHKTPAVAALGLAGCPLALCAQVYFINQLAISFSLYKKETGVYE